jgi:hypothetical protein
LIYHFSFEPTGKINLGVFPSTNGKPVTISPIAEPLTPHEPIPTPNFTTFSNLEVMTKQLDDFICEKLKLNPCRLTRESPVFDLLFTPIPSKISKGYLICSIDVLIDRKKIDDDLFYTNPSPPKDAEVLNTEQ